MGFVNSLFGGNTSYKAVAPTNNIQGHEAATDRYGYSPVMDQGLDQSRQGQAGLQGVGGNQDSLGAALRAQASGQGPSLAQMQLQSATDSNTAQAAGAIASQRGINPGLGARLINQQRAQIQQQAAGQSAMTSLEQQQRAQQQLAALYGQQGQQSLAQTAAGNSLFGTAAGASNTQNANEIQNSLGAQRLTAEGQIENQKAATEANKINAGIAQANSQNNAGLFSGLMGGLSGAGAQALGGASTGKSATSAGAKGPAMPGSGTDPTSDPEDGPNSTPPSDGPDDDGGDYSTPPSDGDGSAQDGEGVGGQTNDSPPLDSEGGDELRSHFMRGGVVGGRAPVQGNSPRNDTVPALLSPGEIVLPRSVSKGQDAASRAAEFVAAITAKKGDSGGGPSGYAKLLAKQRTLNAQLESIHAQMKKAKS